MNPTFPTSYPQPLPSTTDFYVFDNAECVTSGREAVLGSSCEVNLHHLESVQRLRSL
ncbi:hypothetical protein [aff. Roholtiella sp. LEGE 12411]|uniref:hypothetical protein n=1 Tax=aff. Roholtiella sp. LEGE 12411 TaxID=1828822 RepID=UPI00188027F4|nr:hypothetical protein [aff. Roholtiella sp. LEGE 12411]MBE9035360.1 hypothetical protein [aff. Roholtiella sp. LEGE 12411]